MYIIQKTPTAKLSILYRVGGGSYQVQVVSSYADMTNTSFTQGIYTSRDYQGYILESPPQVGIKRQLKGCSIFNINAVTVEVIIQLGDGNSFLTIAKTTILPQQTLFYTDGVGWYKNASNDIANAIQHNSLNGLQGGATLQNYHLELDAYNRLSKPTITSSVTTGTPPFSVSSTTRVVNLNADYLDGNHSTAFVPRTRTLTFNGTSNQIVLSAGLQDLSSDRTWEISLASNVTASYASNSALLGGRQASDFSSSFLPLAGGTVTGNLISRNINAQTYNITASRLASIVATGTSPFLVSSSTVVANLNANTLQGNSASAFARPAGISSSFASLTGVTNSFATIAHTHPYATYIYTVSNTSSTTQNFTLSYNTILAGLSLTGNIAFPVNTTIYEYVAGMYTEKTGVRATTKSGAGSYLNELTYVYSTVPMTASIAVSFRLA